MTLMSAYAACLPVCDVRPPRLSCRCSLLRSWIPQRCRISDPRLVFQNGVHGSSLTMMYERAGDALAALLLVRTESDCVFGAFINEPFCPDVTDAQCVSGSGEMFVFSLRGTSQVGLRRNRGVSGCLFVWWGGRVVGWRQPGSDNLSSPPPFFRFLARLFCPCSLACLAITVHGTDFIANCFPVGLRGGDA